jgi:hypothetical protein
MRFQRLSLWSQPDLQLCPRDNVFPYPLSIIKIGFEYESSSVVLCFGLYLTDKSVEIQQIDQ